MMLKGLDKLREKLPGYPSRKILLLPLRGVAAMALAYLALILLDVLPRVYSSVEFLAAAEPFIPLLGSLVVAALALWLIGNLWNRREEMKAKYGNLAYQKMIPRGVTGVSLLAPLVLHAFTSIRSLPPGPPVNELTVQWSKSLLVILGIPAEVDLWLRVGLAVFLLALGALTARSASVTLGVDYMTVVYLYFPEESEVQQHEIYSILRHPTYLAVALMGAAGLVFRCSVYSVLMFVIIYALLRLHIAREERELIDRFGDSYREYMRRVPALYVRPHSVRSFLRFLRNRPAH